MKNQGTGVGQYRHQFDAPALPTRRTACWSVGPAFHMDFAVTAHSLFDQAVQGEWPVLPPSSFYPRVKDA
jgi:hypothetical protein